MTNGMGSSTGLCHIKVCSLMCFPCDMFLLQARFCSHCRSWSLYSQQRAPKMMTIRFLALCAFWLLTSRRRTINSCPKAMAPAMLAIRTVKMGSRTRTWSLHQPSQVVWDFRKTIVGAPYCCWVSCWAGELVCDCTDRLKAFVFQRSVSDWDLSLRVMSSLSDERSQRLWGTARALPREGREVIPKATRAWLGFPKKASSYRHAWTPSFGGGTGRMGNRRLNHKDFLQKQSWSKPRKTRTEHTTWPSWRTVMTPASASTASYLLDRYGCVELLDSQVLVVWCGGG